LDKDHLLTTASLKLATSNYVTIFIENPEQSGHLCTTATFWGSQGWPL
jgi:hypothetical protein